MADIEKTIEITAESDAVRLDAFIAENSEISRSFAERLVAEGLVTVNNEVKPKKYKVRKNDVVSISIPKDEVPELLPVKMDITILYDCENYAVIDKPAGLTVHPAPGHFDDTLVNAMLAEFEISDENSLRPGIVHRLDKDTSGVMIVAKTRDAREKLAKVFADRGVDKRYLAVCAGCAKKERFIIEEPIGRHPKDRKKMCVREDGKYARSEVTVLKQGDGAFLAEIRIYTGRTHQIRVHMCHTGYPLAGDEVYGNRQSQRLPISRQALHSHSLSFCDPFTNEKVTFQSEVPPDMRELIKRLKL
jgi:23S rRNA pseudouridine1911/1915/1917 synthase